MEIMLDLAHVGIAELVAQPGEMQHIAEILLGRTLRRVEAREKIQSEFHFSPLSGCSSCGVVGPPGQVFQLRSEPRQTPRNRVSPARLESLPSRKNGGKRRSHRFPR